MKKRILLITIAVLFMCQASYADEWYDQSGSAYYVTPHNTTIETAAKYLYPARRTSSISISRSDVSTNVGTVNVSASYDMEWYNYSCVKGNYYARWKITQWEVHYSIKIGSVIVSEGTDYVDATSQNYGWSANYRAEAWWNQQTITISKDVNISTVPTDVQHQVSVYLYISPSIVSEECPGYQWHGRLGLAGWTTYTTTNNSAGATVYFTRHSIPKWNTYKMTKTSSFTSDMTASTHINQYPKVSDVSTLTIDGKHSTCAGKVPFSGSFKLSWSNYTCQGYDYGYGDLGIAAMYFTRHKYKVEIIDSKNNVLATISDSFETTADERSVIGGKGGNLQTVDHRDFTRTVNYSGTIDVGSYSSDYLSNIKAKVTYLKAVTGDYVETLYDGFLAVSGYCYSGSCGKDNTLAGASKQFQVIVPKKWNSYTMSGTSVSAATYINNNTSVIESFNASLDHPDVSCKTETVKLPVEFTFHWLNSAVRGYDYGSGDSATASLVFKKFKYRYEVRYNGTQVGGDPTYVREYKVKDTSLPKIVTDGVVYYNLIRSEVIRDTLTLNVSDLMGTSSNEQRSFTAIVYVSPSEWDEGTKCFQPQYGGHNFGNKSYAKGFTLKRWCDAKWYTNNVEGTDQDAKTYTYSNSPYIVDWMDVESDIPMSGDISEDKDSLHFTVRFRFKWSNLKCRGQFYDEKSPDGALAEYMFKRFKYSVSAYFGVHEDMSTPLVSNKEYGCADVRLPEEGQKGVVRSLEIQSDVIEVKGAVPLSKFDLYTYYSVGIRFDITPTQVEERLSGFTVPMGLLGNTPYLRKSASYSFRRVATPLEISAEDLGGQDKEGRYWIYNHPDAEFTLTMFDKGVKQDAYAGFFVGVGGETPFSSVSSEESGEAKSQSRAGTLLYNTSCTRDNALDALNRDKLLFAGDAYNYGCMYYASNYGSLALYEFFLSNYVQKGLFAPGSYNYRFARPRNLLIQSLSPIDYSDMTFTTDNIFKMDTTKVKDGKLLTRVYHLRDFELCLPSPVDYYYYNNIKTGDRFSVQAKRFSDKYFSPKSIGCEPSFMLAGFGEPYNWKDYYEVEADDFEDGAEVAYRSIYGPDKYGSQDVFSKQTLSFIVVPAVRFEPLTEQQKDSLYHCANAVYVTKQLTEDDVIHLTAKEISLVDKDKSPASRSDYGVMRYWEYTTDLESGIWTRFDTDGQTAKYAIDPDSLDWVTEKNDSDLWVNSAVLLEKDIKTRKVMYFRQAAALLRFTSDKVSDLYSHKLSVEGVNKYCIKVTSDDYYTIVAIPNINKDNFLFKKGGDDLYICYGDSIPAGQDSIVYTLQKSGDIATERELNRLLDRNASFRAERVTRKGTLDITSGIKLSGRSAHLQLQYYRPPRDKAPEDGDTITYRFYVSSCRNTIMDSIRIVTYPHDIMSIDSLVIEDGYIASKDPFNDTILVRAEKGTAPKLSVRGARTDNFKYVWHKKTNIKDYDGLMPLPYDSYIPYWSDAQLVEFSKVIGLACDSLAVDKYYNDYYNYYSTDPEHPEFGGFVVKTKFDSPYVSTTQRREYCYFILSEVNTCRAEQAMQQYIIDNSWQGFTSQAETPWVRLTPHDKYLTMDQNYFFVRREGKYGSPCGQNCPSDSIRVTVRYYDAIRDNVVDFSGADSVVVFFNQPVPALHGTATNGGYGDPFNCPDLVSRRYFWQTTTDPDKGVWETVQNVDGLGNPYLTQPYGEPADKYCTLPEGALTAKGGQLFIRRGVWSILESDTLSAIESFSNVVRVISARLLDEGDLVHNTKAGDIDISLCPAASDFIVVCEEPENIDWNTRYVWELKYDVDGTSVTHTEFSDRYDYVRHRENPDYPEINNAVTVDNVSDDYTVRVFRIDKKTGMYSDTIESHVHVWRMEPQFLYATSMDDFKTWHTVDNPLLTVSAGSLTRLRSSGIVEEEDLSKRLWTLQVQDFVEGQETMGYQSQMESPYLYLYNSGSNRIALHAENLHGCKADTEGSIFVSGPYASGGLRSAFVSLEEEISDSTSDLRGRMVSIHPTVIASGGSVNVLTALEGYDIIVFDEVGRVVHSSSSHSGDTSFTLTGGEGVYTAVIGSQVFRIIVGH